MEDIAVVIRQLTNAVTEQIEITKRMEERIMTLENGVERQVVQPGNLQIPRTEQDLIEISKLPDVVKELQIFEGNPTQYMSWIHNVENILRDYEIVRNKPIYRAILQSIRQKIRGNADSALVSYNIYTEDWTTIKNCLSLHYADKRDLRTLEHQLSMMMQRNASLDEFYANVNHQLSLIINKIKTEEYSHETVNALNESYRNRALDVFIRGVNGDLARVLTIQKPQTLPEAYASCLEIQNLNFRNMPIHQKSNTNTVTAPLNQFFSKREPIQSYSRNQTYNTTPHKYVSQMKPLPIPPPLPPTPSKPPVPMDVDRSLQSRQVNYINRPSIEKLNESHNYPRKQQRLYNMLTTEEGDLNEEQYTQHAITEVEYDQEGTEINEENVELNFMKNASVAFHT